MCSRTYSFDYKLPRAIHSEDLPVEAFKKTYEESKFWKTHPFSISQIQGKANYRFLARTRSGNVSTYSNCKFKKLDHRVSTPGDPEDQHPTSPPHPRWRTGNPQAGPLDDHNFERRTTLLCVSSSAIFFSSSSVPS